MMNRAGAHAEYGRRLSTVPCIGLLEGHFMSSCNSAGEVRRIHRRTDPVQAVRIHVNLGAY
jgi:hypothetical protein